MLQLNYITSTKNCNQTSNFQNLVHSALPQKPYCSYEFTKNPRFFIERKHALKMPFIQLNSPLHIKFISIRIHTRNVGRLLEPGIPTPCWTATSTEKSYIDAVWMLQAAVFAGPNSRAAPIQYAEKARERLLRACGGEEFQDAPAASSWSYLAHNPFAVHAAIDIKWFSAMPVTLRELATCSIKGEPSYLSECGKMGGVASGVAKREKYKKTRDKVVAAFEAGDSVVGICQRFGVSRRTVYNYAAHIVRRKKYSVMPAQIVAAVEAGDTVISIHRRFGVPKRIISDYARKVRQKKYTEKMDQVTSAFASGDSVGSLSSKFGISERTVYKYVERKQCAQSCTASTDLTSQNVQTDKDRLTKIKKSKGGMASGRIRRMKRMQRVDFLMLAIARGHKMSLISRQMATPKSTLYRWLKFSRANSARWLDISFSKNPYKTINTGDNGADAVENSPNQTTPPPRITAHTKEKSPINNASPSHPQGQRKWKYSKEQINKARSSNIQNVIYDMNDIYVTKDTTFTPKKHKGALCLLISTSSDFRRGNAIAGRVREIIITPARGKDGHVREMFVLKDIAQKRIGGGAGAIDFLIQYFGMKFNEAMEKLCKFGQVSLQLTTS